MTFEGYLQIDPSDPSVAIAYCVRGFWYDKSKFKDRTKQYILVAVRDRESEVIIETNYWVKEWNKGERVPDTLREVWQNYFDFSRATEGLRKKNGHLTLETKARIEEGMSGKMGRPAGSYGKYNLLSRERDPMWTERRRCERCRKVVRLGLYLNKHGKHCTISTKSFYVKKADRKPDGEV
jgi:hypothetical protein